MSLITSNGNLFGGHVAQMSVPSSCTSYLQHPPQTPYCLQNWLLAHNKPRTSTGGRITSLPARRNVAGLDQYPGELLTRQMPYAVVLLSSSTPDFTCSLFTPQYQDATCPLGDTSTFTWFNGVSNEPPGSYRLYLTSVDYLGCCLLARPSLCAEQAGGIYNKYSGCTTHLLDCWKTPADMLYV